MGQAQQAKGSNGKSNSELEITYGTISGSKVKQWEAMEFNRAAGDHFWDRREKQREAMGSNGI